MKELEELIEELKDAILTLEKARRIMMFRQDFADARWAMIAAIRDINHTLETLERKRKELKDQQ